MDDLDNSICDQIDYALKVNDEMPENTFAKEGIEVFPSFLDEENCDSLVEFANSFKRPFCYDIGSTAYHLARRDFGESTKPQYDPNTCQLFNVQDLNDVANELHRNGVIDGLFKERLGRAAYLNTCSIMMNDPDSQNRQPLHVDSFSPTFKFMVYLSDVMDLDQGPFTLVKGSHLHQERLKEAYFENRKSGRHHTQMEAAYSLDESTPVLGPKGTAFMCNQSAVHAGWPHHYKDTRFIMMFYISFNAKTDTPWDHGKEFTKGRTLESLET